MIAKGETYICNVFNGFMPSLTFEQGCALAEPGGPWQLTFALGGLENLRFFIQIIYAGHPRFTVSEHWAPFSFPYSTALFEFIILYLTFPHSCQKGRNVAIFPYTIMSYAHLWKA